MNIKVPLKIVIVLCFTGLTSNASAQDTLQISLADFIQRGLDNSGQVDYERQKVDLAENTIDEARAQRFLPKFELNTQHGTVPGVKSNNPNLPKDEYYLDPNLENDWENWAIFTRAEVSAIQPIFAWGALTNAVEAAKAGAEAAQYEFQSKKTGLHIRLYELYYSYILSQEVNRLVLEAQDKIDEIEKQIDEKVDEKDSDIDQSDVYKFQVFKSEFAMRAGEVQENIEYIRNVWNYVLQSGPETVYTPTDQFLDPVSNKIETLDYYKSQALERRAELKGIEAGIDAAEHGIKATRAQNLPMLFLGITGSYANTPNRPRQDNPFIINNTNYASGGFGIGIRQNLDFFSAKTDIEKRQIQYKQAKFLKNAAVDGIMLEISDRYKNANISEVKVDKTDEALVTSKKWLRQEQLDYDFGIGETKDLIDAMQKELELRLQLKQRIFEFNKDMAELYISAGLPVTSLQTAN
ncbi:TolC family protein [Aliifodinibius sp. S!AR15-10]|uniref:TolC family protein n=1 Tax=Aliifodinibius sp. S!AR15-10 TaxID=2950437 RepID=UPI00285F0A70|nr:TolC family protein [Aliifodinibius sp. S!AR15-10]MDR8391131.1 TolC family protein [Aliifodinibius sp. S!AR15-10]